MLEQKSLFRKFEFKLPKVKLYLVPPARSRRAAYFISSPDDAAKLLAPLRKATEEHFVALHLNAKHEVIGLHEVSHGTLSASLVHPREVFKAALLSNSFAILVCHNHPSGSKLIPSPEDFTATKQLLSAGRIMGISVVDHLIVGPYQRRNTKAESLFSFRVNHPQLWEGSDAPLWVTNSAK